MLSRLVIRTAFWGSLALLSAGTILAPFEAIGATVSTVAAPLFSALSLLIAVGGWRRLHRELRYRVEEDVALHDHLRRLREALHGSVDGVFLLRVISTGEGLPDFEIADVNESGAALLVNRTAVIGRRLKDTVIPHVGEDLRARYARIMDTRVPIVEEVRVDRRMFRASWLLHQAVPTSDGLAVTLRDISAQKNEEHRLRRASLVDDLTQLYNRRGFMALAEQQLRIARRQGKDAVVMYVDMDDFKHVNDTHGHAEGDRVLALVGKLLRKTVRDCDVVARLGGDEFAVLAIDADGAGARAIQRRIEASLARINQSGALAAQMSLTLGFTRVRPTDPAGVAELLARADQLLYERKRYRQLQQTRSTRSAASTPKAGRRPPKAMDVPIGVAGDIAAAP